MPRVGGGCILSSQKVLEGADAPAILSGCSFLAAFSWPLNCNLREIQTVPTEASSRSKDIVVTDEYWYSDDLRINMVITHNDPRTGSVTMTVTQVTRTEPDAALFEIPEGYKRPTVGKMR
ncbi:MAG TPA: hypothetical protein VH350_18930 [Candidatus Sulfotelmatobacter sp.]|nr:hypothetical protein [Candidatus Sulfotelmatobacter sp.]